MDDYENAGMFKNGAGYSFREDETTMYTDYEK